MLGWRCSFWAPVKSSWANPRVHGRPRSWEPRLPHKRLRCPPEWDFPASAAAIKALDGASPGLCHANDFQRTSHPWFSNVIAGVVPPTTMSRWSPGAADQSARGPMFPKRPSPFDDGTGAGTWKRICSPLTQPCTTGSSSDPAPPIRVSVGYAHNDKADDGHNQPEDRHGSTAGDTLTAPAEIEPMDLSLHPDMTGECLCFPMQPEEKNNSTTPNDDVWPGK